MRKLALGCALGIMATVIVTGHMSASAMSYRPCVGTVRVVHVDGRLPCDLTGAHTLNVYGATAAECVDMGGTYWHVDLPRVSNDLGKGLEQCFFTTVLTQLDGPKIKAGP